jgi:DNA polymerase III subunit delta'
MPHSRFNDEKWTAKNNVQFNTITGQHAAKELLRKMADSERIPHALMLLGMPGSGGLSLAIAFAQYVLCEDRKDGEACGRCSNCVKAAKFVHPDIHFSFPAVGTNVTSGTYASEWRKALAENPYLDANQWLQRLGAENKQGNINKVECLQIIRKLSLKTFEGRYKILVMWLPEYLGKEGNRLLKLIEEPPENTLLLLVAQNQELILNTILSRCQLVKVGHLSDEEIEQGLVSRMGLAAEKARSVAHLANGDFNEALKIAQQPENDHAGLFLDWLRKCYVGNGVEMTALADKLAALGRENQKQFLQYALHFLREYTQLKTSATAAANGRGIRLMAPELDAAQKLTRLIGLGQIQRIAQLFSDCAYYVERNANQKILFLDASIQLNKIIRDR